MNFKQDEIEFILQLERILGGVKMTVKEFELLMEFKANSNSVFHEDQDVKVVKQQLETSFPEDLQVYKDPLRKIFDAFDIWELS